MQITEIYKSLQGESTHTGVPCVFERLTGCNLRCTWCDSEYSFYGGKKMSQDEIFLEVAPLSPNVGFVEITGGEPMPQELEKVPAGVIKIVDVKCPDSGEPDTFRVENLTALLPHDEVKFVLSSRKGYEFARDFTVHNNLAPRVNAVLFSPPFRKDASSHSDTSNFLLDPRELAEWMLEDNVPARLGLQIHKFVWDPAMKGV